MRRSARDGGGLDGGTASALTQRKQEYREADEVGNGGDLLLFRRRKAHQHVQQQHKHHQQRGRSARARHSGVTATEMTRYGHEQEQGGRVPLTLYSSGRLRTEATPASVMKSSNGRISPIVSPLKALGHVRRFSHQEPAQQHERRVSLESLATCPSRTPSNFTSISMARSSGGGAADDRAFLTEPSGWTGMGKPPCTSGGSGRSEEGSSAWASVIRRGSGSQTRTEEPILSPEAEALGKCGISFGVSTLRGKRPYMEDEFKVTPNMQSLSARNGRQRRISDSDFVQGASEGASATAAAAAAATAAAAAAATAAGAADGNTRQGPATHFFGVFDGHAGGRCSKALTHILVPAVLREDSFRSNLPQALTNGFSRANTEFLKKAERFNANDGSTAITAFIRGRRLFVANVGDSRAVLVSNGVAVPLSEDHKPNKPSERRRIHALGGRVTCSFGIPRVNGILAVSRAFGDRNMNGVVDAVPDVRMKTLESGDDYLVLATDGVWDVLSNQDVATLVSQSCDQTGCKSCAEAITHSAIRKGSMDNTSALVISLKGLLLLQDNMPPPTATPPPPVAPIPASAAESAAAQLRLGGGSSSSSNRLLLSTAPAPTAFRPISASFSSGERANAGTAVSSWLAGNSNSILGQHPAMSSSTSSSAHSPWPSP